MEVKIKDVRNALDNRCFLSALALALTLPDICAKVEFPGEKVGPSYIKWFNKYVSQYYQDEGKYDNEYEGTEFSGEACYSLRCAYLHSGNANLREQNPNLKINEFTLCISTNNDNAIYIDMHGIEINLDNPTEKKYKVRLDVRKLCKVLCDATEEYYKSYKQKEKFNDHAIHIINMEKECES